jgi:hypothetical protein
MVRSRRITVRPMTRNARLFAFRHHPAQVEFLHLRYDACISCAFLLLLCPRLLLRRRALRVQVRPAPGAAVSCICGTHHHFMRLCRACQRPLLCHRALVAYAGPESPAAALGLTTRVRKHANWWWFVRTESAFGTHFSDSRNLCVKERHVVMMASGAKVRASRPMTRVVLFAVVLCSAHLSARAALHQPLLRLRGGEQGLGEFPKVSPPVRVTERVWGGRESQI